MPRSNNIYALLAFCARPEGDAAFYQQLAQAASEFSDWARISVEAEEHGLGPLLYTHLQAADVSLPQEIKQGLQGLYLRHQHANRVRALVLADILAAYQAAGIRVLVLKGAALAHLSYPKPGLRPMRDVDLLVKTSQVRQAQMLLADLGFNVSLPTGQTLPSKHLAAAGRQVEGFLVSVEVHHSLFHDDAPVSMDMESLTVAPLSFTLPQGSTAYTLGYEDMLWHLCHHMSSIAYPLRLVWVADIVGFAEHFASEIDWPRVRRHYPRILAILSLFHHMTPLSDTLQQQVPVKIGRPLQGIGLEFQGWPRFSLAQQRTKGYGQILGDSFFPSDWWLRLYYGVGPGRTIFWHRWVRHPLRIVGFVKQLLLERVGKSSAC